jgi:chaperonin GroES
MVNLNIKPVGDRILIQYVEEKEPSRRGIVVPEGVREKAQEALIVSLGTGKRTPDGTTIPFGVKVGDRVLVSKTGTIDVRIDDVRYSVAREEDILLVLPELGSARE